MLRSTTYSGRRGLLPFTNYQRYLGSPMQAIKNLVAKNMVVSCSHYCGTPIIFSCLKTTSSKFKWNITGEIIKSFNIVQQCGFSQNLNSSSSQIPDSSENWGPYIVNRIHKLEESSRFHGFSMLRWGLSGFLAFLACIYLFRDKLRDNVADEVADVASRSMADENVVLKAHDMTKGVLERLVGEPETITLATEFIKGVLLKDDVRETAVAFAASVLNHPETQAKIQEITRNTIHSILNNEETKSMLLNFIKNLIEDQQTKETCHKLLLTLTQDTGIQELLAEFFKSVLASPKFQMEAIILGREVTNKVVHDKDIQKETGDALWSAVKYGVTPYWFRGEN